MSKSKRSPLEVYLRKRAKELKSDWNDVPMWIIEEANKFFEASKPTKRQEIIERASHYLSGCSSDEEIATMVDLIAKNEDENEIIDYIEGVIVWEKVEYSFTCEQFLDEIGFTGDFYKTK